MHNLVWLVPLLPLAAFAAISLGLWRDRRVTTWAAWVAIGVSWLIAWAIFVGTWGEPHLAEQPHRVVLYSVPTGTEALELGFMVDPLTGIMLFMVPFLCLLIFVYSRGYMDGDPRYSRYFAYVSLFATGMLGLIVSDNLLFLFIFWEVMGLCSYLLIGFWFERESVYRAGLKAFLTTRVGDTLLLFGLLLLYSRTGTLNFSRIFTEETLGALAADTMTLPLLGTLPVAAVISLLAFGGAVGKSAQFPLHVWLPDAMEGPTPVSALIHAATMVSAGVYLVARMFPLYVASGADNAAMGVVAFIGAFTALFAATIAVAQNDVKRVLAFSTISQLGYMMAALGIGAYVAGVFHLITHAFFKALLFLASGAVIAGAHHEQDMMNLGGLRRRMPITFWTFLAGTLALAGVFPWAGFWSKDEILAEAFHGGRWAVYLTLTVAALLTAFYMGRQVSLTFLGHPRGHQAEEAHEVTPFMWGPLAILGVAVTFLGLMGVPADFPVLGPLLGENPFHHYVGAMLELTGTHAEALPVNWTVLGLSLALGVGGLVLGWLVYGLRPLEAGQPDPLRRALGPVYPVLENRYYIDELYHATLVRGVIRLSALCASFDARWAIDPLVNAVGRGVAALSEAVAGFDFRVVDGAVDGTGRVIRAAGRSLRQVQTGKVQDYLLVIATTLLLLLAVFLYL
ncbi:MAG: NADH-quinone oxidoreductase subunit L [Anaerolineae bacterium]|nr:NADH-quinone oxidoreductase subunit L [Anaerolineae bacterium]